MSAGFEGVRIVAVIPVRDLRVYLDGRFADERSVDVEASLRAYEQAVERALQDLYPGSRVLVRQQDHPTPSPPRTRVDADVEGVDTGEIEQEVVDLIAEFDFTACVVYRG